MIKCGICGKEFKDDQFDEYRMHVDKCAYEASLRKKTNEMKKINEELNEVKRAKTVYEGLRDAFKEKYPDIYKANFKEETAFKNEKNDSQPINKSNDSKKKERKFLLNEPETIDDLMNFLFDF